MLKSKTGHLVRPWPRFQWEKTPLYGRHFFFKWAIPGLFFFIFIFSIQLKVIFCRWLDSNRGPLELDANTLPTEPQPLSGNHFFTTEVRKSHRRSLYNIDPWIKLDIHGVSMDTDKRSQWPLQVLFLLLCYTCDVSRVSIAAYDRCLMLLM